LIDVEKPERSSAWVDIDVASVTTRNEQRDEHLRGTDFFDVGNHPTITFRSTSARSEGEVLVLAGNLTVRGATRPVEVRWEFGGMAEDPFGNTRAGFEGTASLSRKDFGLTWNAVLETGGVLVSDKIDLNLEISAVKGDQQ
jgi:polyisoprenoid-binding protein YceI